MQLNLQKRNSFNTNSFEGLHAGSALAGGHGRQNEIAGTQS